MSVVNIKCIIHIHFYHLGKNMHLVLSLHLISLFLLASGKWVALVGVRVAQSV